MINVYRFCGSLMFLLSPFSYGDVLTLKNGDRLNGELVKASKTELVWKSDLIGKNIKIKSEQVVDINKYIDVYESTLPQRPFWEKKGSVVIKASKEDKEEQKEDWDFNVEQTWYQKDVYSHTLKSSYEKDVNNDDHIQEEYLLGYFYNRYLNKKVLLDSSLVWERNEPKNIEAQYTYGIGLSQFFTQTSDEHVKAGMGIKYVTKNLYVPDPDQELEYAGLSFNYDVVKKFCTDWYFYHQHEWIDSFKDASDYTIDTETGFRHKLTEEIYFELKYEWDYDSTPSIADKEQSSWSLGLGYGWD